MTTYQDWAEMHLVLDPERTLSGPEARRHYVGWVSDHPGMKREPIGKQRAAILGLSSTVKRKGRSAAETVYIGVGLDVPDNVEAAEMLAALSALRRAGLITTDQIRRVAAARLGL